MNCSKTTTVAEPVKIEGVSDVVMRTIGLNLTAGTTNCCEILTQVCNAPTLEQLLASYNDYQL
jgi:hypothetical protein